ncbi:MAG: Re/Si-specific NAD(P)(+) transhydrogenase subunit alpha [Candidatus Dasytiphilus stammeri]
MKIGVPKERITRESRVAATPDTVKQLIRLGFVILVESGAGTSASFEDTDYSEAGALLTNDTEIWQSDIVIKVNPPTEEELSLIPSGILLISFIWPTQNATLLAKLARLNITVLSMDSVPRISRAQAFDALTSMANIAGYRAIIEAAHEFGRFFNGQITAAGKILPAKVMVIGAGVAGLSAIGVARSLGAIVRAFDSRLEVKEQVKSMGAEFIELNLTGHLESSDGCYARVMSDNFLKSEIELLTSQVKEVDIIITTAMIPGKPAPVLITREMVETMKTGSIIVDLAAQTGGNCELTLVDKLNITNNGVKIIGYTDLPSRLATQSSQLYSNNLVNLLKLLCLGQNGQISMDFNDIVVRQMTVINEGNITWPPPAAQSAESVKPVSLSSESESPSPKLLNKPGLWRQYLLLILAIIIFLGLASISSIPTEIVSHLTIFALACIIGYYVVWNVSNALHTPLISVTNAISGIIIIGALLQIEHGGWISVFSLAAIFIASINIFGGFTVTQRMLKMFRKN